VRVTIVLESEEGRFEFDKVVGDNEKDSCPELYEILDPVVRGIRSQGLPIASAYDLARVSSE
jgi:hypothetical protein